MIKWNEIIKTELVKLGFKHLANAFYVLLLLPLLSSFIFPQLFASISWQLYLTILTVLLIALVVVSTSYLTLKKKYVSPFKDWTYDDKIGAWTDGKYYYCPNCKMELKVSPMKVSVDGWRCMVCDKFVHNPEYTISIYGDYRRPRN